MSRPSVQTSEKIAAQAARWVARRDAGLSDTERAEFERWCEADPRHASAVEHYNETWSVFDRPREADAILHALHGRVRRQRQMTMGLAAAAVVALAAFWSWRAPVTTAPTPIAHAGGVLLAPETRTLEDGSIVELNRGAEIAVAFTPELRRVTLLKGTGHFQVAKNPARPFVVEVDGLRVRAVGTAFSVQREARQFEVLVTEGRIAVEKNTPVPVDPAHDPGIPTAPTPALAIAAAAVPLASVGPGECVVVPVEIPAEPLAVVTVSPEEMAERLTWRAPRVEFSDTPLEEAVATINRSARRPDAWQIVIDPAARALAREPVSGVFNADNTEAFVRVLELSFGVRTERRDRQIVVRARE